MYLLVQTATAPALRQIGPFYTQLLEVRVSWATAAGAVRRADPAGRSVPTAVACPELRGDVTFDQVAFTYPQVDRPVLHDVSFTIPAGTVTALVGYTGAGKSSIAKLLSRTYDPTGGTRQRRRHRSPRHDPQHLHPTARRRAPGRVRVPRHRRVEHRVRGTRRVRATTSSRPRRDVGAYDLLSMLPAGFDTLVEEEGKNLTAAQRQLIALARAWMTRPDVMVLDEATSLLDADVEQKVLDAVHALGCTTLMITHRENVAKAADSVVVLDAGRVVDAGPVSVVSRPGSPYDRLWNVQEDDKVVLDDVVPGERQP